MSALRIGILAGGKPDRIQASMKRANEMLRELESHAPKIIFVDKNGVLYEDGLPLKPESLVYRYDVLLNILHPETLHLEGVSRVLEHLQVPYTGNMHIAHVITENRDALHHHLVSHGIKTPFGFRIVRTENAAEDSREVFRKIGLPFEVHTPREVLLVKTAPMFETVLDASLPGEHLWVQESVSGIPVAVFVIEGFRNEPHYVTFPVNHAGEMPRLSFETKKQLSEIARKAYRALPLRHYGEIHFVIHPRRGILCIGVHPHPDTAPSGRLAAALGHAGASIKDFWGHLVGLAHKSKKR